MAQEFLKSLLPGVEVVSRGLYADPSYMVPAKVIDALAKHHISFIKHTSTQLTTADLQTADLIFCMERSHEERLLDRYPQFTDKIWLLADFALDKTENVADPIAFEGRSFDKLAQRLYELCQAAAKRITQDFKTQK
jgi:protein-tyrosine-phosphatase